MRVLSALADLRSGPFAIVCLELQAHPWQVYLSSMHALVSARRPWYHFGEVIAELMTKLSSCLRQAHHTHHQ
jgi:hypothetical protein